MDFSQGGADPHAVVKIYVNNAARWVYLAKGFKGRLPSRQLPEAIETVIESKDDLIRADNTLPDTINELCFKGYNVIAARKGPGSVKSGINWLQSYKIIIDPEFEEMREEARLYSWQVDRLTRKVLPVPVDANNHLWDAARYATEDAQLEGDTPDEGGGAVILRMGR